ncbi:IclR family transcriptional regulator domain-containing protein [Actinopolymorpha pittospori]|uniref:Uncharacterized protein n=2 Tax=Actinopolymorpha pittospori TaxID=648752 RepID=A0A927MNC5_9ACTN|nr:hypothetical protein [Actinopolymorpha pittospori]
MAQLVEQIDETVNFGARVGVDLVIVHVLESSQPIRMGAAVGDKDRSVPASPVPRPPQPRRGPPTEQ